MIRTRKEYPEFGCGKWRIVESDRREQILVHACEDGGNAVLAVHNLSGKASQVNVRLWTDQFNHAVFLFGDIDSKEIKGKDLAMELPAYSYEWVRLRRNQEQ
jgi:maltose alpha-D-glucosyltransferase/alpha-amylase